MNAHAHVVGWGKYVPRRVLTNDDLSRMVDTSDEWIRTRTGIRERHLAEDGETTSSMAVQAGQQALEVAGLRPPPAWSRTRWGPPALLPSISLRAAPASSMASASPHTCCPLESTGRRW